MGKTAEWFVRERSRTMAQMYLTRRPDLMIRETGGEGGLDFLVTIPKRHELPDFRKVGVVLREDVEAVTAEEANRVVETTLQEFSQVVAPYPIILLYFTMKDNGAYAAWIAEPIVVAGDLPTLYLPEKTACTQLSAESLDEMLNRVDRWYEAHLAEIRSREKPGKRQR